MLELKRGARTLEPLGPIVQPAPAPVAAPRWQVPAWLPGVVAVWVATRVAILAGAALASWGVQHHWLRHVEPALRRTSSTLGLLAGWDGGWYRQIARDGYPHHLAHGHASALAFFPLLPLLIHAVEVAGLPGEVAGLLVANVAALGALCAVAALSTRVLGDPRLGERTAIYLAISPVGFVLAMVYSESLAIGLGCAAAVLVLCDEPWLAVPLAFLAGLSRPPGFLIALPLLGLALAPHAPRRLGRVVAALAPLAGLGAFMAYLAHHTGDPLAFAHAQSEWGRSSPSLPGLVNGLARAVNQVVSPKSIWAVRDAGTMLITLVLLVYAASRGLPRGWIALGAAAVLIPLSSGATESLARMALLCLPAFWGLALLGERPWVDQTYRVVGPVLLGIGVLTLPIHWP